MGFFSSLRATLPLFLLFFFFSPPVLLKSCPYFTGNTNSVPLDRGVTLTLWAGNYGNLAQCVRNAFEEAVRCHTKFKISNFRIFTNHNPLFLGFDFADVDRTLVDDLDYRCHNNDNGKCDHFFYHFQRPSLSLNQTLAVWECMGDSLNIDEIGTCPNMKNKLLIHIRNGDSFTHNNYLQPPFSSLLTTIYAKKYFFFILFFLHFFFRMVNLIEKQMGTIGGHVIRNGSLLEIERTNLRSPLCFESLLSTGNIFSTSFGI